MTRPAVHEYDPYWERYISLVPGDAIEALASNAAATVALFESFGEAKAGYRYAPGKWSVREILGHIADTERIFAYRALRIARGDTTPLPGFEQDDYVANSGFELRSLASLIEEFRTVRASTLSLVHSMTPGAAARMGTSSERPVSARALVWTAAGHEIYHQRKLRELYS